MLATLFSKKKKKMLATQEVFYFSFVKVLRWRNQRDSKSQTVSNCALSGSKLQITMRAD